jgi:hypothetical protein
MRPIIKRKPKPIPVAQCPVCGRYHHIDVQFGPFCCASCLQTVIRPLILADLSNPRP